MGKLKKKKRLFLSMAILTLLAIGNAIAFSLTKINQDLRQQADTGNYGSPAIASDKEPKNAEFGWNYTTGKASTSADWSNMDMQIAGTYVHCQSGECKRYVVNLPDTKKALNQYAANHQQPGKFCTQKVSDVCVAWGDVQPTKNPNANEPKSAEFGWNYTTGKAATPTDWSNMDMQIAGTYVHCQAGVCKRYAVDLVDTQKALVDYSAKHKIDNASCTQEVSGVCVSWKKNEPTPKPTAKPTAIPTKKPTPIPSPLPTSATPSRCHPDGNPCPNNGICMTTPYGYYCQDLAAVSTNGTKACDGNYVIEYQNGDWKNKYNCLYGCKNGQCGLAPTPLPTAPVTATPIPTATPVPTAKPTITPIPTPAIDWSRYPDWNEACSQTCQPGLKCINNVCLADCPANPNGSCDNNGVMCEDTEFINKGATYVCQNGNWNQRGELKIKFDSSCSEEDKNIYKQSFAQTPTNLLPNESLNVSCGEAPISEFYIDGEKYEGYACGQYSYNQIFNIDEMSLFCNDPNCQTNVESGYDCNYVVTHELAHNQANEENFWGSTDIESYNQAIGCQSAGKGNFNFANEQPVTDYGRSACAEAYAELITVYSNNPCYIKNNYPIQYNWVTTNKQSPFEGDNSCDENSKG